MAVLTHNLNSDLTPEQRKKGIAVYDFGGHKYHVAINGFDDYTVLRKTPLDESSEYYDKVYARWKGGEPSDPADRNGRKTHR